MDPTAITDKDGKGSPWRTCTKDHTPTGVGTMHFDAGNIPVDPAADRSKVLRDLYDFMTYDRSTQGHLNPDGLCFVKRSYPSPQ